MATPEIKRRNYGRGHGYTIDGQKVPGVTTVIGNGLPKPALMGWAAKTIAEYVADRLDQADGHVVADQLVADLGELAHTKGKPWPEKLSRTKVAELLKGIHYEDRDQAAKRGTEVHAIAERLARGEEVEVPEPLTGHVDAYLQFLEDWQPTDALLEVTIGSAKHRYSGTLDMIATLPGLGRCLLDIKTSRSGPFGEVALQLAGYRYAEFAVIDGETVPMPEVDWCGVIWVRADGYDLYPFEAGPAQFRTFLYCRQVGDFLADQDPRNDSGRAVKGAAITPDQALQEAS